MQKFLVIAAVAACFLTGGSLARTADKGHRDPVTEIAQDRLVMPDSEVPVALSQSWADAQNVERAVVVIHGLHRDAVSALAEMRKAERAAGIDPGTVLIVAPQFLTPEDVDAHSLSDQVLRWKSVDWEAGQDARNRAVSSMDVLDRLLAKLADRSRFPKLKMIVLAGHSGGAQLVQRYALLGKADTNGIRVRFVLANPSSYVYFDRLRPDGHDGYGAPGTQCPLFNHWKYGLTELPRYGTANAPVMPDLEMRYVGRDMFYLLGGADNDPNHPELDKSCQAELQGPNRLARGGAFLNYLHQRHPDYRPPYGIVPGVGHEASKMYRSACGVAAIFDAGRCPAP
jgi:hypothetical protein